MPRIVDTDRYPDLFMTKACIIVHTVLRLALIVVMVSPLILAGCSEESTGSGGSGGNQSRDRIESEPTRTLDGRYVYYIATDTAKIVESGIFRAEVDLPVREMILVGEDLHSPTLAPDNNTLAYLNGGIIEYYNLTLRTIDTSSIDQEFESIAWLNDTLLVAGADGDIYVVNELRETATLLGEGWDPSVVTRDTFIYVVSGPGEGYSVVTCDVSQSGCDTIFFVSTVGNVGIMRWPSLEPQAGRLAWGRDNINGLRLYIGEIDPYSVRMLRATARIKPLLLGPDKIIFTSFDGRFWETDWAGSNSLPWWHREGNE
jgi:hypothetical protein